MTVPVQPKIQAAGFGAAGKDYQVIASFLQFLSNDLDSRRTGGRALDRTLATRIRSLVRGVKLRLDEPLDRARYRGKNATKRRQPSNSR